MLYVLVLYVIKLYGVMLYVMLYVKLYVICFIEASVYCQALYCFPCAVLTNLILTIVCYGCLGKLLSYYFVQQVINITFVQLSR